LEPFGSQLIAVDLIGFRMLSAVEFQDQLVLKTNEVRELRPEGELTTELVGRELPLAKPMPSESFGVGHFTSEFSTKIAAVQHNISR